MLEMRREGDDLLEMSWETREREDEKRRLLNAGDEREGER